MKAKLKKLVIILGAFLSLSASYALQVPSLTGRVVDNARIISNHDRQEIESYLENVENQTGAQIAVLTIRSLEGESLEGFSMKVAEKWQLGQKDKDNGVLLLIALKERKIRIETGYGVEGSLTDTKCGLIIRNVMAPQFRNGNYSEGILRAVKNISGIITENEELVSRKVLREADSEGSIFGPLYGFLFVFGWFILFSCLASGRSNHFLPWIIFTSAFRNSHPYNGYSGFGNSSSFNKGFSSHNFGGGGHFGGGGGHFGGGGASGGW